MKLETYKTQDFIKRWDRVELDINILIHIKFMVVKLQKFKSSRNIKMSK